MGKLFLILFSFYLRMGLKKSLEKHRRRKNSRLILMAILLVVLGILYFTYEKFRLWILAMIVVVLGALGMEFSGTDYDVQKLIETKSFSESKVEQTENGTWIISDDCKREKFNCSNFSYQQEAQDLFIKCGGLENDAHGLDGDKDGIVCEALPKNPKKESIEDQLKDAIAEPELNIAE